MRLLLLAALCAAACAQTGTEWRPLFDGASLNGWKETPFTRRGKVRVEKGALILGPGEPMTGVTRTGEFPRSGYEVRFEEIGRASCRGRV